MRTAIISCVLVLVLIITSLILFTVYNQNTRQNELEDSLDIAIEQTLENLKTRQIYSIENEKEFTADFVQNLIVYMESDSDLTIKILNLDIEKGLFDVEVTETYKQPNGSIKNITCRKTVILEEYINVPLKKYKVEFMTLEEDVNEFVEYKTFELTEGSYIIVPSVSPKKGGYTFKGWSYTKPDESNGHSPELISEEDVDGKIVVEEDTVFYAVFEKN